MTLDNVVKSRIEKKTLFRKTVTPLCRIIKHPLVVNNYEEGIGAMKWCLCGEREWGDKYHEQTKKEEYKQ